MDPSQSYGQENLLQDTFLGYKYLNPSYLLERIIEFLRSFFDFVSGNGAGIVSTFHNILIIFSIFFLTVICYSLLRVLEIRKKEHKHLEEEIAEYAHRQKEKEKRMAETDAVSKNPRWIQTLAYLFSQHQSDWKLAVIEADSMLEGLLGDLGFKGDTLGDKLKSADQDKFKSLTSAWEGHYQK